TFTAGITGHATTLFMAAGSQEGSRSYVATERITGRLDGGEEGSVTVQHGGLESDPDVWFGHIVPGTGTGAFAGWSGSARIRHGGVGGMRAGRPAALPGQRGRATACAERLRRGRHRHHGGVPAEGLRRNEGGWGGGWEHGGPVRAGPRGGGFGG